MLSKRYEIKEKAIKLRVSGKSIKTIGKELDVPISTLSGWFKNIELTKSQKEKLLENWRIGLIKARAKALIWHHSQKEIRIKKAQEEAVIILNKINTDDINVLELALAMLYLGEGSKTQSTSMSNSNPLIIRFFISALAKIFSIDKNSLKYELHLRSDQNEFDTVDYWSNKLGINKSNFTFIKDKRIVKAKTYSNYKGVCVVNCGRIAIQRRLVHLGQEFCKMQCMDS